MESKRRTSAPKNTLKRESHSKSKPKKSQSPGLHDSKARVGRENQPSLGVYSKKKTGTQLVKKRIE